MLRVLHGNVRRHAANEESFELPSLDLDAEGVAWVRNTIDAMTLEDVLTMRTGIRWDESTIPYTDPKNSCANMEHSDDWAQFVLDQPMAADPGTTFLYNSGATLLLSQLLKQGTGKQADEYAREHLFGPLGITDTYWKKTPTGINDTEGGLYLTARDLAKLGYLYLHDGMWDGTRLLPEGWVAKATSPLVDTRPGAARSGTPRSSCRPACATITCPTIAARTDASRTTAA